MKIISILTDGTFVKDSKLTEIIKKLKNRDIEVLLLKYQERNFKKLEEKLLANDIYVSNFSLKQGTPQNTNLIKEEYYMRYTNLQPRFQKYFEIDKYLELSNALIYLYNTNEDEKIKKIADKYNTLFIGIKHGTERQKI